MKATRCPNASAENQFTLFIRTGLAKVPRVVEAKRLQMFVERMRTVPSASTADGALDLVARVLNRVEDEHSGVESNPDAWKDDGRMYPPKEDNRREVPNRPSLRRYRSAKHNTFAGSNGAIRIQDLEGNILLEKAGSDGRKVGDLDA